MMVHNRRPKVNPIASAKPYSIHKVFLPNTEEYHNPNGTCDDCTHDNVINHKST